MKKSLIIVLVIVAIAVVAVLTVSLHGNSPQTFDQRFCINGAPTSAAVEYAIQNGIGCFRTDITLNDPQETGSVSNTSKQGAQYLGILDYQTVGASLSHGCVSGCNWTLNDWNASVENAIEQYPDVHEWEIWNEPLVGTFMDGYENGSALDYFNMIKSAYTIIKGRDPNATVVCFGGAQTFPINYVSVEYRFYSQVWSYGASKYCDAISLHMYTLPYYSLSQQYNNGATVRMELNLTLNLYENLTHKPVWITEVGIPSDNYTPGINLSQQKQATFVTQSIDFLTSYGFVKRIYWFDMQDGTGGPAFGLLNATLDPKPAWHSYTYFSRNGVS